MRLTQQITLALFFAPLSLRHLKKNSLVWLLSYLTLGLVVFSIFSWFLLENQDHIKQNILDYFFPQSWQNVSERLGVYLFESQAKVVLSNLVLSGSLVMASLFLFPIKEKYSAKFEQDLPVNNGSIKEFPLIMQALEETKLFIVYLAAQSIILWIGYYPYQWATITSIILSYLFLFFTFGLDFISPTLQRHRITYSLIIKSLLKKTF